MYSPFHALFDRAQTAVQNILGEWVTIQNPNGERGSTRRIKAYVTNTPTVISYPGDKIGPAIAADGVHVQFKQADIYSLEVNSTCYVFFEDRPGRPRVSVREVKRFSSGNTLLLCAWSPL